MTAPTLRAVTLPDGTAAPALGMGTWYLGEDPDGHDIQLGALRAGIDIGLTLIDTAEMYGDGAAEELVRRAIRAARRPAADPTSSWSERCGRTTPRGRAGWTPARGACADWAPTAWTCTCCTG